MKTKPRERRDFAGLEKRRKDAARMFKAGTRQAEVARVLGVSRQSVSRWYKDWQRGGIRAVKAAGRAGRKPRISPSDLKKIDTALRKGARANGFNTDLWTLRRVANVIEEITGVGYHQGHVWRILRDSIGWSLQRPVKKAKERNEEAVKVWVAETWPELKKKAREMRGWLVFQDESGVSQRPPLRRTWALRGETPVIIHSYNWKKISICAAIAYRWDAKRTRLYFQMRSGSYATESLILFLKELKKHFRRQYVILIWDGLPAHKSRKMTEYLQSQQDWLRVERLPGYAPDLNPVESLWGNIKGKELANQSADDLSEVADALRAGFDRVFGQRSLLLGFLNHSGLFFD